MLSLTYIASGIVLLYIVVLWALGVAACFNRNEWDNTTCPALTILVTARNEEENIESCIAGIIRQDYPKHKVEFILIDDHSEDHTISTAQKKLTGLNFSWKIISLKDYGLYGKKKGIEKGVEMASTQLIVCLDADSFPATSSWLTTLASCFGHTKAKLIAAPVALTPGKGLLFWFQQAEQLVLNLISAGAVKLNKPVMCSGANMAFDREAFLTCRPYENNSHVPSGDDIFLLNKIQQLYPGSIQYLYNKACLVLTKPALQLQPFIHQRLRWAGKFKQNSNKMNGLLAALVFFANGITLLAAGIFICAEAPYCYVFAALLILKCLADVLLLFLAGQQLNRYSWKMAGISLLLSILNPLYVGILGVLAIFIKPVWKGRKA